MAKKQQDPSLEFFANLRTIFIFVIFGSSIAAFVEYHANSSAIKTYDRWQAAIDGKVDSESFLTFQEFKGMIKGYPKTSEPQSVVPQSLIEEEKSDSEEDENKSKDKNEPEEKKKKRRIIKSNAKSKYVDYTWTGLYSTSVISVQMSDLEAEKEGEENTSIYRISSITH